jgi:uncharacterized protein (TIGR00251 family)
MIRPIPGGVRILVKVRPQGGRDRVEGVQAGRIRVAVGAPPDKGKANRAAVQTLASALGVPRSAVSIVAGGASREKTVEVRGISAAEAERRLTRFC